MFMFRSRRTTVTRRLLKAAQQKRRQQAVQDAAADGGGGTTTTTTKRRYLDNLEEERVMVLLKKLQENQLAILWGAVEGRGQDGSNCVLLPREHQPHVLCCQTWRWPDLEQAAELRRLPVCRSAYDPVYICCNPYHWSRIYQSEAPPPPYSRSERDRLKPEDRAPSEIPCPPRAFPGSFSTSGDDSRKNPLEWCKLAYWEQTKRVGPLFPVESPAVNIFGNVPYGDGLCLETLAQHNCNPPESVRHTRCKIGLGVTLSLEDDHVWVYNRSDSPIFVNSLTLESNDSLLPTRVPAEQCLCVFDPVKAALRNYNWELINHFGPVDPNSIRISFAKGWGPRYCRQEITSCPCWIEILLAPCR